jgi:hypothetical protein
MFQKHVVAQINMLLLNLYCIVLRSCAFLIWKCQPEISQCRVIKLFYFKIYIMFYEQGFLHLNIFVSHHFSVIKAEAIR